jgi:hypothetical protein
MRVGGQRHTPANLPLGSSHVTHFTGDWMGLESIVLLRGTQWKPNVGIVRSPVMLTVQDLLNVS